MKNQNPLERPNQLHYYKSIDGYVLVPEPKYEDRPIKEILEDARNYAQWLEGEAIETIPILKAEPMTLRHYMPVFIESLIPPEIKSDNPLDHMFSHPKDPFYLFLTQGPFLLDTQIEILGKQKRRFKNKFKKDRFFNTNIHEHGQVVNYNIKVPGPAREKVLGEWDYYNATVIEHLIADKATLTIDQPKNFEKDNVRALVVTATDLCTYPKYSYFNAMGAYEDPIHPWVWNRARGFSSLEGTSGMGVPIIIYTKEPKPYEPENQSTKTKDFHSDLDQIIKSASRDANEIIEKILKKR